MEQRPRDKWSGLCGYLSFIVFIGWLNCAADIKAADGTSELKRYNLDIPSSQIDIALFALARETGKSLIIPSENTAKKRSQALKGSYTLPEALSTMLRGTNLIGGLTENGMIVISFNDDKRQSHGGNIVNNGKLKKTLLTSIATFLFGTGAGYAQDTASNDNTFENEYALDEIVVTAERKRESLQNVPIAVSAFSAASLASKQIDSPIDLVNYVPNLYGANNVGVSTANSYFIRGLGNGESIASFDPPVGTYVDEIYIARQNGNNVAFFDVDRIEVLRGPQGTLFGRNTTGGAVSVSMKKPSESFGGYIVAGLGNYDEYVVRGSIDVPLSDTILTKFSGFRVKDDGYVYNETTDDRLNDKDSWGARSDFRFLLSDTSTWDLSAEYVNDKGMNIVNYVEGGSVFVPPTQSGDRISSTGLRQGNGSSSGTLEQLLQGEGLGNNVKSMAFMSNLKFDTAIGSINLITGYRDLEQDYIISFVNSPVPPGLFSIANQGDHSQFSQEIKYSHDFFDGFLDLVVGGYFFTESNNTDFATVTTASGNPFILADRVMENDMDSYAIYSQGDLHLTDKLTFTLGARWTKETKTIEYTDNGTSSLVLFGLSDALTTENIEAAGIPTKLVSKLVTPRFALEYQVTDDLMIFTSATQGFKSGGWNARGTSPSLIRSFERETAWSYEMGTRSTWFDNRLRLNVTGFYMDVKDHQVPIGISAADGSISFVTGNFSDFENKGVEVELEALLTQDLTTYISYGYQDPSYKNLNQGIIDQQANCLTLLSAGEPTEDYCGSGIVTHTGEIAEPYNTPKHTLTIGGSYTYTPPSWPVIIRPSVNFRYTSSFNASLPNLSSAQNDAFWLMNAGVTMEDKEGIWTLTAECKNCSNQVYVASELAGPVYLNDPRRWSVTLQFRF